MEVGTAVTLCQKALWLAMTISAPMLIAGILVGFGVGLFQALTQIQEQTLAVVLKIVVMLVAFAFFASWMLTRLVEFSRSLFEGIPESLSPFL